MIKDIIIGIVGFVAGVAFMVFLVRMDEPRAPYKQIFHKGKVD